VDRERRLLSSSNFPQACSRIQALPLTALINALRAVVLEGAGITGVARRARRARGVGSRSVRDRATDLQVEMIETDERTTAACEPGRRAHGGRCAAQTWAG